MRSAQEALARPGGINMKNRKGYWWLLFVPALSLLFTAWMISAAGAAVPAEISFAVLYLLTTAALVLYVVFRPFPLYLLPLGFVLAPIPLGLLGMLAGTPLALVMVVGLLLYYVLPGAAVAVLAAFALYFWDKRDAKKEADKNGKPAQK